MKQLFETTDEIVYSNSISQSPTEIKRKNATIKENVATYPEIYYL